MPISYSPGSKNSGCVGGLKIIKIKYFHVKATIFATEQHQGLIWALKTIWALKITLGPSQWKEIEILVFKPSWPHICLIVIYPWPKPLKNRFSPNTESSSASALTGPKLDDKIVLDTLAISKHAWEAVLGYD